MCFHIVKFTVIEYKVHKGSDDATITVFRSIKPCGFMEAASKIYMVTVSIVLQHSFWYRHIRAKSFVMDMFLYDRAYSDSQHIGDWLYDSRQG